MHIGSHAPSCIEKGPVALDRAWRAGRVKPDALVLLTSFGAGLSWGANLVRWTAQEPAS